jgi:hypothetical protein
LPGIRKGAVRARPMRNDTALLALCLTKIKSPTENAYIVARRD